MSGTRAQADAVLHVLAEMDGASNSMVLVCMAV
jgi:hypothetical protein